jgi:hypothetical protein
MPLIEIDALPQPAGVDTAAVTAALNHAVAEVIPCRLDAVWTVGSAGPAIGCDA